MSEHQIETLDNFPRIKLVAYFEDEPVIPQDRLGALLPCVLSKTPFDRIEFATLGELGERMDARRMQQSQSRFSVSPLLLVSHGISIASRLMLAVRDVLCLTGFAQDVVATACLEWPVAFI